ncbi:MAG: MBL fold metallo-hydrolase [Deltaproteobacteria bacterium]|nr:MBL fold metallo-hydrolase [Deltaproteobacteria bacterium]MBI3386311.1 MBL fold metallo-hydrolase [Deltaproteobacteria bacterium]
MRVTFWGTRGSLASPGNETARYGGNTSCIEVRAADGALLALDAGTGIRRLGGAVPASLRRVDVLLTHLHMDHIQGLGFFGPLYNPNVEVHIWGPASTTMSLRARLTRYLSPPFFPIHLRELPCVLTLHEVPCAEETVGPFRIVSTLVCHPGPTVGYRITADGRTVTYLPDHEPALGAAEFPASSEWTSGFALAADADLLIHDAQYADQEYRSRMGWGHSTFAQAVRFATVTRAKQLIVFHHDPERSDDALERVVAAEALPVAGALPVSIAAEGTSIDVGATA